MNSLLMHGENFLVNSEQSSVVSLVPLVQPLCSIVVVQSL